VVKFSFKNDVVGAMQGVDSAFMGNPNSTRYRVMHENVESVMEKLKVMVCRSRYREYAAVVSGWVERLHHEWEERNRGGGVGLPRTHNVSTKWVNDVESVFERGRKEAEERGDVCETAGPPVYDKNLGESVRG